MELTGLPRLALFQVLLFIASATCVANADATLLDQYYQRRDAGSLEPALAAAQAFAGTRPGSAEAWGCLGEAHLALGNWYDAVQALRRCVRLAGSTEADRDNLALALTRVGWQRYDAGGPANLAAAAALWREAAHHAPHSALPRLSMAHKALDEGHLDLAERHFMRALQADPESAYACWGLGQVYYQQGDSTQATRALDRAIYLDPSEARPHHTLGMVHWRKGDWWSALESYRRAVALAPDVAKFQLAMGSALSSLGDPQQAEAHFSAAVLLAPEDPRAHQLLADCLLNLGKLVAAETEYSAALKLSPGDPALLSGLGRALCLRGECAEAEKHLARAAELVPDSPRGWADLGDCQLGTGKPGDAEASFRRAAAMAPDAADHHTGLARAQQAQGKLEQAVRSYQRATEIDGDSPVHWGELSWVLFQSASFEEAQKAARRALDIDPLNRGARLTLAAVLLERGDAAGAREQLQTIAESPRGTPLEKATLATCLAKLEDVQQATEWLALALPPADGVDSPWVWYYAGEAQRLLGDNQEAARSYVCFLKLWPHFSREAELRDYIETHTE